VGWYEMGRRCEKANVSMCKCANEKMCKWENVQMGKWKDKVKTAESLKLKA
jgi:hypothetical protein